MPEEFNVMRAALIEPKDQMAVPVHTPIYRYLVCDLMTDQLLASIPLTSVTFDRRLSRIGSFSGTWQVPNREQAILADGVSKNGGRYALWVLRDDVLWWGGIIWNCRGAVTARSYDTVTIQAATFDSYLEHRYLDLDLFGADVNDLAYGPIFTWQFCQLQADSDIGVVDNVVPVNLANAVYPISKPVLQTDQKTYWDGVKVYTDADPGVDYTMDVFLEADGSRTKKIRTAGSFKLIQPASPYTISGYRLPGWEFTRDASKGGTYFQAWGDIQDGNVGSETRPVPSNHVKAQDLLDAGWPRLDVITNVGEIPTTGYQTMLTSAATALRDRYSGIRDVISFEVDLGTSEWHPNRIGQNVTIKRSKKDLWRPGETSTITPVVVEFAAPERGQPERVKFTIDGAEEG